MALQPLSPRLRQALHWHTQGQFKKAWDIYGPLAVQEQHNPTYWLALGVLGAQQHQKSEAQQCFQRMVQLTPTQAEPWQPLLPLPVALWTSALRALAQYTPQHLRHWYTQLQQFPPAPPLAKSPPSRRDYLRLLLHFLYAPHDQALQAAEAFLQQQTLSGLQLPTPQDTRWEHQAQAEAWRFLRQHHSRHQPQDTQGLKERLRQEICYEVDPDRKARALDLWARLCLTQQDLDGAKQAFQHAVQLQPTPFRQLQSSLCHLPLQAPSVAATHYHDLLAQLKSFPQPVPLENVLTEAEHGCFTLFDWNYSHPQDAHLRAAHGRLFRWNHSLPPLPTPQQRLGIVVTPGQEGMFYFAHHVLLQQLATQYTDLEIHLISFGAHDLWQRLQSQYPELKVHTLSPRFGTASHGPSFYEQLLRLRQQLALQWAYFWEVGTDTLSFLLPYFRLAPVQFSSWGSVSSTGHPDIDVFLSTPLLNPPAFSDPLTPPAEYFSETLIHLPQLSVGFEIHELQAPSDPVTSKQSCSIGCLHTPRKNSAAFLQALHDILHRHQNQAPNIKVSVFMIESPHRAWQKELAQQVASALGAYAGAVEWLPRMSPDRFAQTLRSMDFLLDAFPFGGGKLAYDSLIHGIPLLSLKGSHLRGRIPTAFYTELSIYDDQFSPVQSPEDYVASALRLIQEPALRQHLRQRLIAQRQALTQRDLAKDFIQALNQMRTR